MNGKTTRTLTNKKRTNKVFVWKESLLKLVNSLYRTFNMEDFKVSLESLYNNKIKDISFDEEETYQE